MEQGRHQQQLQCSLWAPFPKTHRANTNLTNDAQQSSPVNEQQDSLHEVWGEVGISSSSVASGHLPKNPKDTQS